MTASTPCWLCDQAMKIHFGCSRACVRCGRYPPEGAGFCFCWWRDLMGAGWWLGRDHFAVGWSPRWLVRRQGRRSFPGTDIGILNQHPGRGAGDHRGGAVHGRGCRDGLAAWCGVQETRRGPLTRRCDAVVPRAVVLHGCRQPVVGNPPSQHALSGHAIRRVVSLHPGPNAPCRHRGTPSSS